MPGLLLYLLVNEVVALAVLEFYGHDVTTVNGDGFDYGIDEVFEDWLAYGLGKFRKVDIFAQPHGILENKFGRLRNELFIEQGWGDNRIRMACIQLCIQGLDFILQGVSLL